MESPQGQRALQARDLIVIELHGVDCSAAVLVVTSLGAEDACQQHRNAGRRELHRVRWFIERANSHGGWRKALCGMPPESNWIIEPSVRLRWGSCSETRESQVLAASFLKGSLGDPSQGDLSSSGTLAIAGARAPRIGARRQRGFARLICATPIVRSTNPPSQ